jgi:hypothetical protein
MYPSPSSRASCSSLLDQIRVKSHSDMSNITPQSWDIRHLTICLTFAILSIDLENSVQKELGNLT